MESEHGADMRALVEALAKALVDEPEQVVVRPVEGEQLTVLELSVSPTDLGKVIGQTGADSTFPPHHLVRCQYEVEKALQLGDFGIAQQVSCNLTPLPHASGALRFLDRKCRYTCKTK